ncbi:hypothetical protein GPECTOR_713g866 [Gonium pectorale]|uniref:Uncharacterized protein n=1 Tax=Gonium pectorale TaxID=33097 RepID=A0A150FU86_GONPE|nr:hypothetical protein GPECTOR_713g866 [Gonium pectorale]|eukprot:KXZ41157.1 hypothetical protein GPECTOR_713g866 [Gonium pectorale]
MPGVTRLARPPELQAALAACLALHALPPLATASAALAQLRQLPAWKQLRQLLEAQAGGAAAGGAGQGGAAGGGLAGSWALLPLLSLLLPGLSHEAMQLLAAALPL